MGYSPVPRRPSKSASNFSIAKFSFFLLSYFFSLLLLYPNQRRVFCVDDQLFLGDRSHSLQRLASNRIFLQRAWCLKPRFMIYASDFATRKFDVANVSETCRRKRFWKSVLTLSSPPKGMLFLLFTLTSTQRQTDDQKMGISPSNYHADTNIL